MGKINRLTHEYEVVNSLTCTCLSLWKSLLYTEFIMIEVRIPTLVFVLEESSNVVH